MRALTPTIALLSGCAATHVQQPAPALPPLEVAADLHEHLTMRTGLRPWFHGEPGSPPLGHSQWDALQNLVDPEQLRAAGIHVVGVALWPPPPRPAWTPMDEVLEQLRALHELVHKNPTFALARSPEEAETIVTSGRIALIASIEGAECVHRVEDVDLLFSAGARMIGLVHFVDNAMADAADNQFGGALGLVLNGRTGGLSPLGRAAVERMFQLGMLVDLAHSSQRTREDVLALAEEHRIPVIASHEGPALEEPRTLDDRSAVRIGKLGGVIGIGLFRTTQQVPEPERWPGFARGTCDEVIAHWKHYAALAGPEAITLGTDLDSPILRPDPGGACPTGVRNSGDLRALLQAVVAHGVPQSSVGSGGRRVLEAWRKSWSQASEDAQHEASKRRSARPEPFVPPL